MWTATLISKEVQKDKLLVGISYSNETNEVTVNYRLENNVDIKAIAREKIKELEAMENSFSSLPIGILDLTETVVTPDSAVLARIEFLTNYNKYVRAMKLVDLGLVPANNAKLIALKTKLQTDFKPEYFDLL